MTDPLDALIAALSGVLAEYPDIAAAYLFGSIARNEPKPESDVDVGIVFRRRGDTALDHERMIGDIASRLEQVTAPRPVDVVVLEDQGPVFAHNVLLEGRLLCESDRERRVQFEAETYTRAFDWRPTWEMAKQLQIEGMRAWLKRKFG